MVRMPAHTGTFLDSIDGERLFALFCLVCHCGLRRDEVVGLSWAEVNLDQGVAYIRETGSGDDPKSESSIRAVPPPVHRGRGPARLAQAAGRRAARVGPGLDGQRTRVHP